VRYHDAIRGIPARYPMPNPMTLSRLERFIDESQGRYRVRWERQDVRPEPVSALRSA
jgi:hypothetical protein